MPIPQSQSILKSYFETGDFPTQAQFAEFIDTMFFLYQDAQANAANALAAANSALAQANKMVPAVFVFIGVPTGTGTGSPITTIYYSANVIVPVTRINTATLYNGARINLTAALPNTNYRLEALNCTEPPPSTTQFDVSLDDAQPFALFAWG